MTAAEDDVPGRREQLALLVAAMRGFEIDDGVRSAVLDGYQHCEYLGDAAGQARFVGLVRELADQVAVGAQTSPA